MAYSPGPNAQPIWEVANRRWLTPLLAAEPFDCNGGPGAGTECQLAPPSVVVMIAGHDPAEHGTEPKSHQSVALMAVKSIGLKPAGTGA